jgi:hypothetical protein
MTTPTPDVREIAARATFEHEWRAPGEPDWDDLTPGDQESYRHLADAVLSAVTPVIRQQVAEEIAQAIDARSTAAYRGESGYNDWDTGLVREGLDDAAAIARSHAQHPEEKP